MNKHAPKEGMQTYKYHWRITMLRVVLFGGAVGFFELYIGH
jgi:hypothetical protein